MTRPRPDCCEAHDDAPHGRMICAWRQLHSFHSPPRTLSQKRRDFFAFRGDWPEHTSVHRAELRIAWWMVRHAFMLVSLRDGRCAWMLARDALQCAYAGRRTSGEPIVRATALRRAADTFALACLEAMR